MADRGYIQTRSGSSSSTWKSSISSFTTEQHSAEGVAGVFSTKSEQRREAFLSGNSNSGSKSEAMSLRESLYQRQAYSNGVQEASYEQRSIATEMKTKGYVGSEGKYLGIDGPDQLEHRPHLYPTLAGSKFQKYAIGQDSFSNPDPGQAYTVQAPDSPKKSGNIQKASLGRLEAYPAVLSLENGTNESISPLAEEGNIREAYENQSKPSQIVPPDFGWDNSTNGTPRSQLSPVMKDTDLPSDGIVESSKVVQAQSGEVEPVILQASDRGEDTLAVNNCRENMYQLSQCPLGANVTMSSEDPSHSQQLWNDRSVDSSAVTKLVYVGPSRAVREQYIKRLRGVGEHCLRVGTMCAKNVWFWVAIVGVVAGLEGFNEEKDTKSTVVGEDLWSDDDED